MPDILIFLAHVLCVILGTGIFYGFISFLFDELNAIEQENNTFAETLNLIDE